VTAPNHALTGALIGLTVHEPLLAGPLALASHFACDAIPHYDVPGKGTESHLSTRFIREQLVFGACLCLVLVAVLAIVHPQYWLLAAACAFLAASPDMFWLPRFIHEIRTGKDRPPASFILRFHAWVQWKTGPKLWWVETLWAIACVNLLVVKIR
jgi:hypothetical protein